MVGRDGGGWRRRRVRAAGRALQRQERRRVLLSATQPFTPGKPHKYGAL